VLTRQPSSGTFDWEVGGAEHVARYWRVFLKPQFGGDWISIQSRPRAHMLGPLGVFQRWFTLTAILTLLTVLVASLVQIRRTLDPIADLHDATQRIAGGDLAARVKGGGKDEFGDLARSFNFMTEQLVGSMRRRELTECALLIARDEAWAAARTEASFVANVSHELRTPLTSILSCAEILRDYQDVDPQMRADFVNGIADQARRLKDLVEKVLELSVRSDWTLVETDLAPTLRAAVASLPPHQQDRVRIALPADPAPVAGAGDKLIQLWLHLFDNAIKFSEPGTPIEVRVDHHGAHCAIEVTDHGVGMAADHTKCIFEPFRQVGCDMMTEKTAGIGLGLTLARNIVERHKGQIHVVSELGKGSTFRVLLPLLVAEPLVGPPGTGPRDALHDVPGIATAPAEDPAARA
jgi:signal transduction histidine kinase